MLCVQIVQLLEDDPFEAFKPIVEGLIAEKEQNKQRAAAELLAGVLGGKSFFRLMYQRGPLTSQ